MKNELALKLMDTMGVTTGTHKVIEDTANTMLLAMGKSLTQEELQRCKDELIEAQAAAYSEVFTEDELKELIVLHENPTMKKLLSQHKELMRKIDNKVIESLTKYVSSFFQQNTILDDDHIPEDELN